MLDHASEVLGALLSPGVTPQFIATAPEPLRDRDFADPLDGVIFEAIRQVAAEGGAGASLVLNHLVESGALARDVDKRITSRLADLVGTVVEPLQVREHVRCMLRDAELRIIQAWSADVIERAATLPYEDVRELERTLWRRLSDVHARIDSMIGSHRPQQVVAA